MAVMQWLDDVGKFKVEKIPCPHFSLAVDLAAPRTGVIHTTEGAWISSMGVFKTHYAPHFIVGAGRIAQLVPIGLIGAALVTHNDHAIVQIEVVSKSQQSLWLPDDATVEALAALMAVCQREYGIPLTHPWPDGDYGVYGDNPHRHAGKWGVVAGWFGHGDVPAPDAHWDPGALRWSALLAKAAAMTAITQAPGWAPPYPPPRLCAAGDDTHVAAAPPPVGSKSALATWMQTWLHDHGEIVKIDGDFGDESMAAMASYMAKH